MDYKRTSVIAEIIYISKSSISSKMKFLSIIAILACIVNTTNAFRVQNTEPLSRSARDEISWNRRVNGIMKSRRSFTQNKVYIKQLARKMAVNKYALLRSFNRQRHM